MTYIWCAYYSDWSDFALFSEEIEALRFALGHGMQVVQLQPGRFAHEQTK